MSSPISFTSIHLAKRPGNSNPVTQDCFNVVEGQDTIHGKYRVVNITPSKESSSEPDVYEVQPPLPPGCVLVESQFLSVDPYLRCQFNEDSGVDYAPSFSLNQPITSGGVGIVRASTAEELPVGTLCGGNTFGWQWQRYNVFGPTGVAAAAAQAPLPAALHPALPSASHALGLFGVTGLTAYFGIVKEVEITSDSVVVVSAAAGGTGSVVCQIAKRVLKAKRVIGIAGGPSKCGTLLEKGWCDAVVDYKNTKTTLDAQLKEATQGEDVTCYFDNVGGPVSDAVIEKMGKNSTVVLCGQIARYNDDVPYPPPLPEETTTLLAEKSIKRERYLVLKYSDEFEAAVGQLVQWFATGVIEGPETVVEGIGSLPSAFEGVMNGANVGKMVVKL